MQPIHVERFLAKIDFTGECWPWTAACSDRGYGCFAAADHTRLAHLISYELWHGPIPEGLEVDHTCRVRHCAYPGHLEAITHRENLLRGDTVSGLHARQTHCVHGHEFTPENVYIRSDNGGRVCRTCKRQRDQTYRALKEALLAGHTTRA